MKIALRSTTFVIAGFVFAIALTALGAPANPPANNVAAPINVSASAQAKAGRLSLGTTNLPVTGAALDVNGAIYGTGALVNGRFQLVNGSQALNRVLISDSAGVATWVATSSLGFGTNIYNSTSTGVTNLVLDTYQYTSNPPKWPRARAVGSDSYKADTVTSNKLCTLGGFTSVSGMSVASFDSPDDNALEHWDAGSNTWIKQRADFLGNGVGNVFITTLTCARIGVQGQMPPAVVYTN